MKRIVLCDNDTCISDATSISNDGKLMLCQACHAIYALGQASPLQSFTPIEAAALAEWQCKKCSYWNVDSKGLMQTPFCGLCGTECEWIDIEPVKEE